MKKEILKKLYEHYIKGTPEKSLIVEKTVSLCSLAKSASVGLRKFECKMYVKAYINTKSLKHIYDKKTAEEFDFIIANLHTMIKYPDYIYRNKNPKRGDFCFVKTIKKEQYLCSLELDKLKNKLFVVTAFKLRKENYIKNYELLWNWRDGNPSS